MRYSYSVPEIVEETGLPADMARTILAGFHATGRYNGATKWIRKGGRWACSGEAFDEIFGEIVAERQREMQALAEERLVKGRTLLERRTWEARIRREQAEARRDAVMNTARARYRAATKRRFRKAAHFPLAGVALRR